MIWIHHCLKQNEIIQFKIQWYIIPFVDEKMNGIMQNQQMNLDSYCSFNWNTNKISRDSFLFTFYLSEKKRNRIKRLSMLGYAYEQERTKERKINFTCSISHQDHVNIKGRRKISGKKHSVYLIRSSSLFQTIFLSICYFPSHWCSLAPI